MSAPKPSGQDSKGKGGGGEREGKGRGGKKDLFDHARSIVDPAYVEQARASRRTRDGIFKDLLCQRCLPKKPWDERTLSLFLAEIASMDSNNFADNVGVGEREGRVWSPFVRARHSGLAHGIGRSGDIGAIQPKAAGSSLLMRMATAMMLHCIRVSGVKSAKACLLLPLATGMAHLLTFSYLRLALRAKINVKKRSKGGGGGGEGPADGKKAEPRYVIWPRIDQKTCLKSIHSAGLIPIVVENILKGDQLETNLQGIAEAIDKVGAENVLCVLSTSSCFAPRAPDKILEIAKLCDEKDIPHVINNAYGLQSRKIMGRIATAADKGRVDVFIQSTDKNLMVPVGGSIIAGFDKDMMEAISKTYPGRASMAPVFDVFVTLVSLGEPGYKRLIDERRDNMKYFKEELGKLAAQHGERVLNISANPISIAMTIDTLVVDEKRGATYVGSMLFQRCVSGPRTVARGAKKSVCGIDFEGYGSHYNNYPHNYLVMACPVGLAKTDIDKFLKRFQKVIKEIRKEQKKLAANSSKEKD